MEKNTIGSFLAALRKSRGMTQQDVADYLNVSNKTVSKWERGTSYPEITLIPVIAELFGVTSDEILQGRRIINEEKNSDKQAVKSNSQLKRIIDSSIIRFKNISLIALALTAAGMILLFTIAYSFYRPVIGFGLLLMFLAASVTLELVQTNLTNAGLKNSEALLENNDILKEIHLAKNRYAFAVLFANMAAVVFGLPFVLLRYPLPFVLLRYTYYSESGVIAFSAYLALAPVLLAVTAILFLAAFSLFETILLKEEKGRLPAAIKKKIAALNSIQGGLISLSLLFVILGIMNYAWEVKTLLYLSSAGFVSGALAQFGVFVFFVTRHKVKTEKFLLLAEGLRNMLLGFAASLALNGVAFWEAQGATGYSYDLAYLSRAAWITIGTTMVYVYAKKHLQKNICR
ncbi:MAG TPA: helix-turn-helix transcriptional regulator [Firmicutes bacterium]|nr:helix-turn-helix transcriptional regulator [Bacillota bacterium]